MSSLYDKITEEVERMSFNTNINGGQILINLDDYATLTRELTGRAQLAMQFSQNSKIKSIYTQFGKFDIVIQEDWLPDDEFSIVLNII